WLLSPITNTLPWTKKVGSPCESFSLVSGRARQKRRTRLSRSAGMMEPATPGGTLPAGSRPRCAALDDKVAGGLKADGHHLQARLARQRAELRDRAMLAPEKHHIDCQARW